MIRAHRSDHKRSKRIGGTRGTRCRDRVQVRLDMSARGYRFAQSVGRACFRLTIRFKVIRRSAPERVDGPLLIACSHISHLEPFLLSLVVDRQIDWMARIEFYRYAIFARIILWMDAFAVRRYGVPVSAIRTAIARLSAGRCVGVCPEGGVTQGANSVLRGGPIKKGICLVACRTGTPVLPCIMLGTHKMNEIAPWLPLRNARLWVA